MKLVNGVIKEGQFNEHLIHYYSKFSILLMWNEVDIQEQIFDIQQSSFWFGRYGSYVSGNNPFSNTFLYYKE